MSHRVAIIGATGKGDYGHGLDTAFQNVSDAQIVAVADHDPAGRKRAGARLGVDRLYEDFRRMLNKERPDIVCVGPRWLTDRCEMVEAVAAAGCHIYCEKPFIHDLVSADKMVAACKSNKSVLAMAHQWRAAAPVVQTIDDVRSQKYGKLLRMRARPKDDRRGGGEELLVHGTHMFDLMIAIAGHPQWVSGHVMVGAREATRDDRREASEPVGPVAGDSISAMFGFVKGVRGYFESTANLSIRGKSKFDNLYGLWLECERAALHFRQPGDVYIYPAPIVLPDLEKLEWKKLWIENWHFTPDHKPRTDIRRNWIHTGNKTLAQNLVATIEGKAKPLSGIDNAMSITEMVQGVYASHLDDGRRLTIPLKQREHPLG